MQNNKTCRSGLAISVAAVLLLVSCSKQDVKTRTTDETQQAQQAPDAPQSKHSKIKLPSSFPEDLPLPDDIQLEAYFENPEDDAAQLDGLLAGLLEPHMQALHAKMIAKKWQPNLVIPQGQTAFMNYSKPKRHVVIELNQSVAQVVKYSVNYQLAPKQSAQATQLEPQNSNKE